MKRQWLDLKYDKGLGYWVVILGDHRQMIYHRQWFDLSFGETSVLCRLEWDRKWYIVMKDMRFYLHPKETYKVEI